MRTPTSLVRCARRYETTLNSPTDATSSASTPNSPNINAPTRHGRTHQAFVAGGRLNLRNARFRSDPRPLDGTCDCPACRGYSRAYLRHLCMANEMLGAILLTQHNIRFFHRLMSEVRAAIASDSLAAVRRAWLEPPSSAEG